MSEYRGLRWIRDRQNTTRQSYEEITPSSGWTQDPNSHFLLIDLPGFKKGDVKLQIDKAGTIAISGERLKGEGKHEHFEKAFTVPKDADTESISMRFEGETLRVTIPKVTKEKKEEKQSKNEASSREPREKRKEESDDSRGENGEKINEPEEEKHRDHMSEDPGERDTPAKSIVGMVIEKKGILLASLLSFTLGFLLSQKIHPLPPK